MQLSLSATKILKNDFDVLMSDELWTDLLLEGDFYGFEKLLYQKILGLYDKLCETFIGFISSSSAFEEQQRTLALTEELKKF